MEKEKNTIIERAKREVEDFSIKYGLLEQKVILGGFSQSTLINYGRCIARVALQFNRVPMALTDEQINGYLFDLKQGKNSSHNSHTNHKSLFGFS